MPENSEQPDKFWDLPQTPQPTALPLRAQQLRAMRTALKHGNFKDFLERMRRELEEIRRKNRKERTRGRGWGFYLDY